MELIFSSLSRNWTDKMLSRASQLQISETKRNNFIDKILSDEYQSLFCLDYDEEEDIEFEAEEWGEDDIISEEIGKRATKEERLEYWIKRFEEKPEDCPDSEWPLFPRAAKRNKNKVQ